MVTPPRSGPPVGGAGAAGEGAPEVLCAGFAVLDVLSGPGVLEHRAGGTAGNVAANLSWLGVSVGIVGRIGDDPAGRRMSDDLEGAGVDVTWLGRESNVNTPTVVHKVSAAGRHTFLFTCPTCRRRLPSYRPPSPGQAAHVTSQGASLLFLDRASAAAVKAAAAFKARGAVVVFEPNGVGRPALTREVMALASVVKISDDRPAELLRLLDDATEGSPGQVQVVTRGAKGLSWRRGGGSWADRHGYAGNVVDPGGAGDWVTAGLIAQLASAGFCHDDATLEAGLRLGQAYASLSCGFLGARGLSMESRGEELRSRLESMLGHAHHPKPGRRVGREPAPPEAVACGFCLAPVAAA